MAVFPFTTISPSKTIFPLENPVQHYDWGSQNAMSELFGMANESGQPMAEL